jgi:hypothetical protein
LAQTILIPVQQGVHPQHLEDYLHSLDENHPKRVAAFFLNDIQSEDSGFSLKNLFYQQEFKKSWEREAIGHKVDFMFLPSIDGRIDLAMQTQVADLLFLLWPQTPHELPPSFFASITCPVLFSSRIPFTYEHIILVFDASSSVLGALKSFLHFFGEGARHRPVTVLKVISEDEQSITMEKYFMNHIRQSFSDIGVLPIHPEDLPMALKTQTRDVSQPLIIMGKQASQHLQSPEYFSQIVRDNLSVYYAV